MKTIIKVIAALGVLALLGACIQPTLEKPAGPGPGTLRVSLDGGAQRTLLPAPYAVTGLHYTLAFTATGGGAQTESVGPVNGTIATGETSGEFTLAAGTWKLEIKGFASEADASNPSNALASGEKSGIVITGDAGTAIEVELVPQETGLSQNATGTLKYDISFPEGLVRAELALYQEDGTLLTLAEGKNPVSLMAAGAGEIVLASGVYNLAVSLYAFDRIATKGAVAYIYDGLTTIAAYSFGEDDFVEHAVEAITSFTLKDGDTPYEARINHAARTITAFVPASVTLSGLTAEYAHIGLAIASDPATPDFSGAVSYTVTMEDGAEISYAVKISANEIFTVAELTTLLTNASANTADTPLLVKVSGVDFSDTDNGYAKILSAISTYNMNNSSNRKYVSLDLSAMTMNNVSPAGQFNPAPTASNGYIVGLVLPDAATSIRGLTNGSRPLFGEYLNALRTVEAKSVTSVGANVFGGTSSSGSGYNCRSLVSVSMPAATSIGEQTFYGCIALTTVSLPAAESIGNYAFYGCTNLVSVSLPAATSIGNYAFNRCTSLASVSLPAATSIGASAFYGCTSLVSVSLPVATDIGDTVFQNCENLVTLSLPKAGSIGTQTFWLCTALETVSLPAATSIGNQTFFDCTALKSVYLPVAESIKTYTFSGCTSLETVFMPEVASIGSAAFSGCASLVSLSLPKAKSIDNYPLAAFQECVSLATLDLPALETITGGNPILGCVSLTALNVGADNPNFTVRDGILLSKDETRLIAYPGASGDIAMDSLTSIDDYAFYNNASLASVSLPNVVSIGNYAFSGTGLVSVSLPNVVNIGNYAFSGTDLASVSLPEAAIFGTGVFQNCTNLAKVVLDKATTFGNSTFYGCTSLASVYLPKAASFGTYSFRYTGTESLTVTLGATPPTLGQNTFNNVTATKAVTVKIPSGATGYGTAPTDTATNNWGNAFRGKNWDGTSYGNQTPNSNVTLTFQELTAL
jgi:hypothetical protein